MLKLVNVKHLWCKLALIFFLIPIVGFALDKPKRSTSVLASIDDSVTDYGPYIVKTAFRSLHFELMSKIESLIALQKKRVLTIEEQADLQMLIQLNNLESSASRKAWFSRFHFRKGTDPIFKLAPGEPPRTAVTGVKATDPIYFNLDRIGSFYDFKYSQAVSLLIHELGHKIKKPSQFDLDRLATSLEEVVAAREKNISLSTGPVPRDFIFVTTEPPSAARLNMGMGNFVPSIIAVVEGTRIKPFLKFFTKPPVRWNHGYFETSQRLDSAIVTKDTVKLRYSYTRNPENPYEVVGDEEGTGYEREMTIRFHDTEKLDTLKISSTEEDARNLRMSPINVEMTFVMDHPAELQCKGLIKGAINVDMRDTNYRFSYSMGSFAYDKPVSLVFMDGNDIVEEIVDGKWLEENDALVNFPPIKSSAIGTMLLNTKLSKYLGRNIQLIGFYLRIRSMDHLFYSENIDGIYYLPLAKPIDLAFDKVESAESISGCTKNFPATDVFNVCAEKFGATSLAVRCFMQTDDVEVVRACEKNFGNSETGVACTKAVSTQLIDACVKGFGANEHGSKCSSVGRDAEAIPLCTLNFTNLSDQLACSVAKTAQIVRSCIQPGQGIKKHNDKEMRPYPPLECIDDYSP